MDRVNSISNTKVLGFVFQNSQARDARHDILADQKVSQAMNRQYTAIPADTTFQRLVDDHILGSGRRSFVVKRSNEAVGLLTLHHVKEVPRSEWPTTTSAQAMIPIERTKRVRPDAELWTALEEMNCDGVNQLPVMVDGQIQGILSRKDVVGYLRTLRELSV